MKNNTVTRREFIQTTAAGTALAGSVGIPSIVTGQASKGTLAITGGKPVRTTPFPGWPVVKENDEKAWLAVLHEGKWCRLGAPYADKFEEVYAKHLGAKYCVATASGTTALQCSLNALDVGPGDEVLVSPYTFCATVNVILLQYALPIFVDSDPETLQVNADLLEQHITEKTRCILPVHLGGNPANLDKIIEVGKKHKIPILEDACQAHTGEWRGKRVSTIGDLGCFSFQASKNLNSGEGGAILSNDEKLIDRCFAFHNNGRGRRGAGYSYPLNGTNARMTEFQAALILQQFTRWEEQSKIREQNAEYLTKMLKEIPGIMPAKQYAGTTRNGYHLYMFRYDKAQFKNAPRSQFLKALEAEGIPCAGGYTPLNKESFIKNTLSSRAYQNVYSKERLEKYHKENNCPANDKLCDEAVWFFQTMLLGPKEDMEQIAAAVKKIQANSEQLAKA